MLTVAIYRLTLNDLIVQNQMNANSRMLNGFIQNELMKFNLIIANNYLYTGLQTVTRECSYKLLTKTCRGFSRDGSIEHGMDMYTEYNNIFKVADSLWLKKVH